MIVLWTTTLLASLLGSLHCAGMCGPIAGLASTPRERVALPVVGSLRRAAKSSALYNGARLLGYLVLGGFAGGLGSLIDTRGGWVGVSQLAAVLAGTAMTGAGLLGLLAFLGVRLPWRGRSWIPSVASRLLSRLASRTPWLAAATLGVMTACLPCGWLWAFVLGAAGTGSPLVGASMMAAFWAGTVPALVLVGLGTHTASIRLRSALPWLLPALITAVGITTLARPASIPVRQGPVAATPGSTGQAPPLPTAPACH